MRPTRVARQLWRGATLAGIGLAGGAALVTARHLLMTPQPLDSGLPGEGRIDRLHGGDIYYSVAGPADGRPVVLLHGFYPGASNFEYRAVFSRLAETYRVYAPDWLGFGMSERPALTHTGEFYATTLKGFLRDVVGAPATVVASGLAGNVATRAASDAPELVDRLTLVAPEVDAGMRLDPTLAQAVTRLFQKMALGITPYAIVSMRPALRLAASLRSAVGPMQVDEETIDHLYASAHQFGGEYATLSLFTGELDLPMRNVFPLLETPTLIMVGARDTRHPLSEMERLVTLNPHADLEVVSNAGETVYLDQPTLFIHAMHRWLGRRIVRRQHASMAAHTTPPATDAALPAPVAPTRPSVATSDGPDTPTPAAVKIVPVVEVSSGSTDLDPSGAAPRELLVTHTPEGESMTTSSDRAPASQPLSLEPTYERRPGVNVKDPSARLGWSAAPQSLGGRSELASDMRQIGAFRYAPEIGAHVVRSEHSRGASRSLRRR